MPYYLVRVSYKAEAWAALLKNPQNRLEAVQPAVEQLGGKIESSFLTFGEYDLIAIMQMPDNVSAAAISMAVMAGGAVTAVNTTPLITWDEGLEAMKKAHSIAYRPPSSSPIFLERT